MEFDLDFVPRFVTQFLSIYIEKFEERVDAKIIMLGNRILNTTFKLPSSVFECFSRLDFIKVRKSGMTEYFKG